MKAQQSQSSALTDHEDQLNSYLSGPKGFKMVNFNRMDKGFTPKTARQQVLKNAGINGSRFISIHQMGPPNKTKNANSLMSFGKDLAKLRNESRGFNSASTDINSTQNVMKQGLNTTGGQKGKVIINQFIMPAKKAK